MDNIFDLNFEDVSFEWDDNKEHANFVKHGVHFRTAVKVFIDPDRLIREDTEHSDELRYDVLGKVDKVLFVVCTLKKNNVIGIISARKATVSEKEIYDHGKNEL